MATLGGRRGTKTRTACQTCRQRRVKCGEERPHCHRCIKAGRTCEGYQTLLIDGAASIINRVALVPQPNSSASLLSRFTATQDEWQAYRLYTQRISSTLGEPFDTDVWQTLVMQISHDDAAVRNGVFSLGNLFRHRFDKNNSHISMCACARCVQALKSYNKAIASFATRSARVEDPVPVNAALASCALFICIEYYRKNDRNAIALINKGCGVLSEHLQSSLDARTSGIDPGLLNLFTRLRVLSSAFGQTVPWALSPQYSAPKDLHDPLSGQLESARSALYEIMIGATRLRRHTAETLNPLWPLGTSDVSIEELHHERDLVISELGIWNESFAELQTALNSDPRESSLPALILYGHFLQTKIYAETALELSQDCFDKYLPEFACIAEAAEIGLHQLSAGDQISNFSFENNFLGMLYLCALKCRHPTTRRRLVELMHLCRDKEGLWHKAESITVASRVMGLEEGRVEFTPARDKPIDASIQPPIRFYDVLCDVNYVAQGKTMVNATYILYDEHSGQRWLAMKETLVVDES